MKLETLGSLREREIQLGGAGSERNEGNSKREEKREREKERDGRRLLLINLIIGLVVLFIHHNWNFILLSNYSFTHCVRRPGAVVLFACTSVVVFVVLLNTMPLLVF